MNNEYITIQKNLGHSPRKLRLVADMIRKMTPLKAVGALQFTNRAAAIDLAKAIKTALANAGGHADHVEFKSIEINEGLKIKRYRVGTAGRGRGRPYKKRLSHIKIVLSEDHGHEEVKAPKAKDQKASTAPIVVESSLPVTETKTTEAKASKPKKGAKLAATQ